MIFGLTPIGIVENFETYYWEQKKFTLAPFYIFRNYLSKIHIASDDLNTMF